jgi:hypothetical protein
MLVRGRAGPWKVLLPDGRTVLDQGRGRRAQPDVGDDDLAAGRASRLKGVGDLAAMEGDGESRLERRLAPDLAAVAVQAAGYVDGHDRRGRAVRGLGPAERRAFERAAQARPEQGVDDQVG